MDLTTLKNLFGHPGIDYSAYEDPWSFKGKYGKTYDVIDWDIEAYIRGVYEEFTHEYNQVIRYSSKLNSNDPKLFDTKMYLMCKRAVNQFMSYRYLFGPKYQIVFKEILELIKKDTPNNYVLALLRLFKFMVQIPYRSLLYPKQHDFEAQYKLKRKGSNEWVEKLKKEMIDHGKFCTSVLVLILKTLRSS